MVKKELIIISTTITGLKDDDKIRELFKKPSSRPCSCYSFEENFYPVFGIDSNGIINCFCDKYPLSNDLILLIIPHSEHFDNDEFSLNGAFSDYLKKSMKDLDILYVLLHEGYGSIHDTHQNAIFELANKYIAKIRVAKCHHTQSVSNDPKYAIGDGLGIIAKALCCDSINIEAFHSGLDYLKSKPYYYNPLFESIIHLHKSLTTIPLKLKNNWNETAFNIEKTKLQNSSEIRLAKNILENISFINSIEDFYIQLITIENEITLLSFNQ